MRHTISRHSISILAAMLLPLAPAGAQTATPAHPREPVAPAAGAVTLDPERLEAAADAAAKLFAIDGRGPGFTVAVARDGNVVFEKSYGLADIETGVKATPETVYRIASITKQFTAAAVMRLVEQGKLSLEDPITKHLPDFPTQGHDVTIRHLLSHTSGIKNYNKIADPPERFSRPDMIRLDVSYADMVELVGTIPFDFAPGERWQYNNTAFWLLGEIVTRVSGAPWDRYLEEELLRPHGLEKVLVADHRRIVPNRAAGYLYESPENLTNAPFLSMHWGLGCGALSATAADLARWAHLLHTGTIVSPGSYAQMITPTTLADGSTEPEGFGLHLDDRVGRRAIHHGGNTAGFTSYLAYYPESGVSIAALSNSRPRIVIERIEAMLARAAFGLEGPADFPLTPEQLGAYAGTYLLDRGGEVAEFKVTVDDGRLRGQMPGGRGTILRNQGDHEFIPLIDEDVRITFEVSGDRAVAVTMRNGEREMRGKRKE
jgi:D-alanyl-D-alanine carboxypeptidase